MTQAEQDNEDVAAIAVEIHWGYASGETAHEIARRVFDLVCRRDARIWRRLFQQRQECEVVVSRALLRSAEAAANERRPIIRHPITGEIVFVGPSLTGSARSQRQKPRKNRKESLS